MPMENAEHVKIYLFVDVNKTFNYFTKQLPDTTNIMTKACIDVVTKGVLLTKFHLQHTARVTDVKSNQIYA